VADGGSRQRKPDFRTVVADVKAMTTVLAMEAEAVLGRRTARVLGGLVLFAILVGTLRPLLNWYIAPSGAASLNTLQAIFGILTNIFTIAAIAIGAVWTYFNYFKGRTYRMRLEPEISSNIKHINGVIYLLAIARIKNVGISKIDLLKQGSALSLELGKTRTAAPWPSAMKWSQESASWEVFQEDTLIEPGETVQDKWLIEIPKSEHSAAQLKLRIRSKNIKWVIKDIVVLTSENGNSDSEIVKVINSKEGS
jgi:hypothetical protein